MAPAFSLDDYLQDLRERLYGAGPATDESADAPSPPAGAVAEDDGRCPAPTLDDVRPVARLRDRLAAALAETSDAECAAALSELSRESDLYPGLDANCRPVVMSRGGDFVAHVSAALLAGAIDLVAGGRRSRIKRCKGPECGLPFLERESRRAWPLLLPSVLEPVRRPEATSVSRGRPGRPPRPPDAGGVRPC